MKQLNDLGRPFKYMGRFTAFYSSNNITVLYIYISKFSNLHDSIEKRGRFLHNQCIFLGLNQRW